MQASSSAAAPQPNPNLPKPGPAIVPPREPRKRRTALWGLLAAIVVAGGSAAYYLNTNGAATTGGGGPLITVPTVAVAMGDLHATIRVNGTIAAETSQALLAPRILGSRGDFNRGGDGGGAWRRRWRWRKRRRWRRRCGGGMMGGGGPGGDFQLALMSLAKAGTHVKQGDVIAQFDPQNQMQRLDDYKDSVVQQENTIKKMLANLAATKEAHDQSVRIGEGRLGQRAARSEDRGSAVGDRRGEVQADGGRVRSQVQAAGGGIGAGGRIAARADPLLAS